MIGISSTAKPKILYKTLLAEKRPLATAQANKMLFRDEISFHFASAG
jgi:hypothetical protein